MGHRVNEACMMHGVAGVWLVWWSEQQAAGAPKRQKSPERIGLKNFFRQNEVIKEYFGRNGSI
jgi:hypothetical protein